MTIPSSTKLHEAVFNRSPLPIMITDAEGRYVEVNPAAERLLGAPRAEILGKPIAEFVAPMRVSDTKLLWSKFRDDGTQTGTFTISRADGTDRVIRYDAVTEFLPGLQLSIARDITEDK